MKSVYLLVLLAVACLLPVAASAATLRGFGAVQESPLPAGQGMRFACDSPAHAVQLIHKLARDMELSVTAQTTWVTVTLGDRQVPVLVRPGLGSYLVLAQGSDAYCFTTTATDAAQLATAFPAAAPLLAGAVLYDPAYRYPTYLDKWSTVGIGTWYTPFNPFNDNPKGLKDVVPPHFEYLTENDLTVHVGPYGAGRRETIAAIHRYNRPFHVVQWHTWDPDIARLDPFELIQPNPALFSTWAHYYGQISNGGDQLNQYRNWVFQGIMKGLVNDPLLVDWDEPHGEIGPGAFQMYWDYGPKNQAHFTQWLQSERGYTLKSLGQAWYGEGGRFRNWEQVPIPFDYSFFGADQDSLFADRAWKLHTGDLATGRAAQWQTLGFDDAKWTPINKPGGDLGIMEIETHQNFWYRGTLTVPASYLAKHKGPLYLVCAAMNQARGPEAPNHIWLNGVELGGLTGPGGFWIIGSKEATGLVRPGVNQIAYCPTSPEFAGSFFLSPHPVERYPYRDSFLNARFVDWRDYVSACAVEQERQTIQAIRGIDPNRPIKIMAAADKDLFNEVMYDYGGFPHNTGDEAFYRPWDRRGGYPYGLPGSAEPSASMPDPKFFQRWLGWFTFSGLNAFDNFIDIEAMMYTPSTPYWKANFPYLHLANRYDLRKPDLALLWSGENNRLNPGPGAAMPYIYDLGRGDLHTLGYSFAYLDEPGLHRGFADSYKVLFDCGTWVMSPQTVADLTKYVENGGTYVALQETGRHTLTQRDAWPLSSLTGFKVQEVRPMGGFVSILNDQPIFTKLAGKNFMNQGRCVDYSGYNYADACLALTPVAPDTQALARYRDGAIAVGMRKLGKGRVIVLGSPFWRDSYDKAGMWWPGPQQNAFIQDLLTGLGLPPDVPADTQAVWRDRFVANNGTEEYLILWNPSDTDPQTFTTDWHTSFPATQVLDPKTGQPVEAKIDGTTIHLSQTLQPFETRILAVQSPRPPADTVADWYAKTARVWRQSKPGQIVEYPDLPVFYAAFPPGAGQVVDTSYVKPELLVALSSTPGTAEGWDSELGFIQPHYAAQDLAPTQSVLYRSTVDTPPSWQPGDRYFLRLNRQPRNFGGGFKGEVYLNGKQVGTSETPGDLDVSQALRFPGANVLVILANNNGFAGDPSLMRQPAPEETLPLDGEWTVRLGEDTGTGPAQLPGSFTGLYASREIVVPASWKGSHVFLNAKSNYARMAVNERVFFYNSPTSYYMDITPWVKFGEPNQILLQPGEFSSGFKPGKVTVTSLVLERVAVEKLKK
ncbi:MAG TPA: beta-galactosidase trimerization domain-containing protein [Armatimonadota bacterium]|jgi:hypothetical protein